LLRAREIARQRRENPPPLAIAVFYLWRLWLRRGLAAEAYDFASGAINML
jgi:hypothetical protein